jgi:hypothetical protein
VGVRELWKLKEEIWTADSGNEKKLKRRKRWREGEQKAIFNDK